jgi:hypothetical protein
MIRPRVAVDTTHDCLWAIVPNGGERVYRSFDRGENWIAADSGLTAFSVYSIACGSRTWLGTRGDGVWQWSEETGLSSDARPGLKSRDRYPTVVAGSLDYHDGATVLDCCGRKALGLLKPGVYFVSGKTGTSKVLLAR